MRPGLHEFLSVVYAEYDIVIWCELPWGLGMRNIRVGMGNGGHSSRHGEWGTFE